MADISAVWDVTELSFNHNLPASG